MNRNDLCWCGSGLKYKKCHLAFDEKLDAMKFDFFKGQVRPPHKIIKNAADIEGIRKAGVINDAALDLAGSMVREGIDTESIDTTVRKFIEGNGGIPACLNYEGFPKSICISLNDVVCHGIPSKKTILKEGDILNIDITTIFKSIGGFDGFDVRLEDMLTENDYYMYDVYKHCSGTATRESGRASYNDVLNIITRRNSPMILDFSNVHNVSSSYIDEFVAKLVVKTGFYKFNQMFRIIGMNPTVEHLCNRAVAMRIYDEWKKS